MSEPDFSADEELEAAALAAALDEGRSEAHLPGDALEVAALLRFSGKGGQLSGTQSGCIRAELLASLPAAPRERRRAWSWIWLGTLGGVGAFAALMLTLRAPGGRGTEQDVALQTSNEVGVATPAAAPAQGAAQAPAERTGEASRARSALADKADQAPLPQGLGPVRQRLEQASLPAKQARSAELGNSPVGRELRRADELGARANSPAELERARAAFSDVLAASASLGWSEPRLSPLQQDMLQRLAEAALRQGQPQQALEWAQQGLDLDGPPSPLLGLLWLTLGEAHEALGDRAAAAQSYLKALSINETLLKETLSP